MANSDGCRLKPPSAIQRRAPPRSAPMPGASTSSSASTQSGSIRLRPALEQVEAHARHQQHEDDAGADRDDVLAEEQVRIAVARLGVEVADVEHHDDAEAEQPADRARAARGPAA